MFAITAGDVSFNRGALRRFSRTTLENARVQSRVYGYVTSLTSLGARKDVKSLEIKDINSNLEILIYRLNRLKV